MMATLYQNETEREQHRGYIEAMAIELRRPVEEIALFYEDALTVMTARARIRDYLPILVAKNVKRTLGATIRQK